MKLSKTLMVAAALMGSSTLAAKAEDINLSFIMCGDVRPADQAIIDKFQTDNPGIKVNMEAVPWGTCQDKSMTLAAAGDPVSVAYMGSRTLLKLSPRRSDRSRLKFTAEEDAPTISPAC